MTEAPQIVFLIPCYQPTQAFLDLVGRLREADRSQIVVVDDGSGPAYAPIFQRAKQLPGVTLLTNAVNLGKGAALKHGMNYILVSYPDSIGVVTADADGQHAVADILKLTAELKKESNRVVFGARQFSSSVPLRSRFGNVVSRYIYRFLIGLSLTDTQTGLRGIPKRLMELCLGIRANRYEFETEQLVLIKSAGMPVHEIPIQTIYIDDNRESHFRPLLDSARIYFVLLRQGVASLVTAATDLAVFATAMALSNNLVLSNAAGRLVALWVQWTLLQRFVFRAPGSVKMFVAYLGLVAFSGFVSVALQLQLAKLIPYPIPAKTLAEVVIFLFNFLFLRDLIFRVSGDTAHD